MPRRVSENLRESLLDDAETGMGYQIATITGSRYLILNAELAFELLPHAGSHTEDSSRCLQDRLGTEDMSWLKDRVQAYLAEGTPLTQGLRSLDSGERPVVETHGSYPSSSLPREIFVRYSAFRRDFRIDPRDFSVRPGTYATTATDAPHVPSGLAAVGRYALPNQVPAVHKFTLTPPKAAPITCGTAAPRFGQAGGGVEVLFANALPKGTATGPILIPER